MNFIFDIDGTICFDGCSIDSSIKQRLFKLRQANHNVIFASARPIRDLLQHVLLEICFQSFLNLRMIP